MIYYKTFRVPFWVHLEKTQKNKTIRKWFVENEANVVDWPSNTFRDTVMHLRKKGWFEFIPESGTDYRMDPQVLSNAFSDHIKKHLDQNPQLIFRQPLYDINRKVDSDDDYLRIFNDCLTILDDMSLSKMFKVGEKCYRDVGKKYLLYFTEGDCNKKVLTRISDRVITIGEGGEFDIDVTKATSRTIGKLLEQKFSELFQKQ